MVVFSSASPVAGDCACDADCRGKDFNPVSADTALSPAAVAVDAVAAGFTVFVVVDGSVCRFELGASFVVGAEVAAESVGVDRVAMAGVFC